MRLLCVVFLLLRRSTFADSQNNIVVNDEKLNVHQVLNTAIYGKRSERS